MNSQTNAKPQKRRDGGMTSVAARPGKNATDEFGRQGTHKTIPGPKADNESSEELGNTPHIGKTPYTRG